MYKRKDDYMNKLEVLELLKGKEYDFLRTEKHLKDNIILLVLGGSLSYGTNVEGSDIDIRGVCMDTKDMLLGFDNFEQHVDAATDTTIYSLRRFIELAYKANPNILEMLGVREEDIIYITPAGRLLMDNASLFLSKRIVHTISGYADQQLRRLEGVLHHNTIQTKQEENIKKTLDNFIYAAKSMFTPFDENMQIEVTQDVSDKTEFDEELFISLHVDHYPIRDFNSFMRQLTDIVRTYDKNQKGHRNNKKDAARLDKHAMHLVRLYTMGTEALEQNVLKTYRKDEHDILMEVRNGKYQNDDNGYKEEFFTLLEEYRQRFEMAKEKTSLPERPNMERIEQLQKELLESVLYKGK